MVGVALELVHPEPVTELGGEQGRQEQKQAPLAVAFGERRRKDCPEEQARCAPPCEERMDLSRGAEAGQAARRGAGEEVPEGRAGL